MTHENEVRMTKPELERDENSIAERDRGIGRVKGPHRAKYQNNLAAGRPG